MTRKKTIPHMCVTCVHYDGEHLHCMAKDSYVSYGYVFEVRSCKGWQPRDGCRLCKEGKQVNGFDVEEVMASVREAIRQADGNERVEKPISFALYKMWRAYDYVERRKNDYLVPSK